MKKGIKKANYFFVSWLSILFVGSFFVVRPVWAQNSEPTTNTNQANQQETNITSEPSVVLSSETAETVDDSVLSQLEKEVNSAVSKDETVDLKSLVADEPKILPNSKLYVFKDWWRGLKVTFTFDKAKKAEKKLEYANERIVEAKKLLEKKGPAGEKYLNKIFTRYSKDLSDVAKYLDSAKNKGQIKPVEEIVEKITDSEIKKQKIFEKLENKVSEATKAKIIGIKNNSAEHLGKMLVKTLPPNKITEKVNKVLERQPGSNLKDFKNLEILKTVKERVPAAAKSAIEQAEEKAISRLSDNISKLPAGQEALVFKKYVESAKGNPLRHFEILDEFKQKANVSPEILAQTEEIKEIAAKKVEKRLGQFKRAEDKKKFLQPFTNGDINDLRVMEQLSEKVLPDFKDFIRQEQERSFTAFKKNFTGEPEILAKSEKVKELAEKIKERPDPITLQIVDRLENELTPQQRPFAYKLKEEIGGKLADKLKEDKERFLSRITTDDPQHIKALKEIKETVPAAAAEKIEAVINKQVENIKKKLEKFRDPEQVLEFRAKIEGDKEIKEEILKRKPQIIDKARQLEKEKIRKKLEKFDDPEKMLMMRRQLSERLENFSSTNPEVLKLQPEVLKNFDNTQAEVIKQKLWQMEDPKKILEFRGKVEKSMEDMGFKEEVLKHRPAFFKEIDNEQLKVMENKIKETEDPGKIVEFRKKIDEQFNHQPELKEKILKNRPDFIKTLDYWGAETLDNQVKKINDPNQLRELDNKLQTEDFGKKVIKRKPWIMKEIEEKNKIIGPAPTEQKPTNFKEKELPQPSGKPEERPTNKGFLPPPLEQKRILQPPLNENNVSPKPKKPEDKPYRPPEEEMKEGNKPYLPPKEPMDKPGFKEGKEFPEDKPYRPPEDYQKPPADYQK